MHTRTRVGTMSRVRAMQCASCPLTRSCLSSCRRCVSVVGRRPVPALSFSSLSSREASRDRRSGMAPTNSHVHEPDRGGGGGKKRGTCTHVSALASSCCYGARVSAVLCGRFECPVRVHVSRPPPPPNPPFLSGPAAADSTEWQTDGGRRRQRGQERKEEDRKKRASEAMGHEDEWNACTRSAVLCGPIRALAQSAFALTCDCDQQDKSHTI